MESKHLEEFILLSELKNYREAAKHLGISSSTLTKHIVILETELGFPLFERTTRKVELNEYGEAFLPYAKKIVQIKDYGCSALNRVKAQTALTIGSVAITSQLGISDALARYRSDNPECAVNIIEASPKKLESMLRDQTCNLVFLRQEVDQTNMSPEFNCTTYARERLSALLPPEHPFASFKEVRLSDLQGEEFIFYPPNSGVYESTLSACRSAGFEPNVVMTNLSAVNCARLTAQGMGVALIPMPMPLQDSFKGVSVVPVVPPTLFHINILYLENQFISPSASRFLEYIVKTSC